MCISSILFYVDDNYIVIVYYLCSLQCLRITTLDFGVLEKDFAGIL